MKAPPTVNNVLKTATKFRFAERISYNKMKLEMNL